jgi:peroxiredoxin
LPHLVDLYDEFGSMGVRVVSIDSGVRPEAADKFLSDNNVRHTVLNDLNSDVRSAYRVVATPLTLLIDQDGRVMYRHVGFAEEMVPRLKGEVTTLMALRDAAPEAA